MTALTTVIIKFEGGFKYMKMESQKRVLIYVGTWKVYWCNIIGII